METFRGPRDFVHNPAYLQDRDAVLKGLDPDIIDNPIVDLILGFARLPECFTMQCCYGHFVWAPGQDPRNLERLPETHKGEIEYRIAYIAFCLENSAEGRGLRESLEDVASVDPEYVQFGSPDWFWDQWPNSYALQVEPVRHRCSDSIMIGFDEALQIEKARDDFYDGIRVVLKKHLK